MLAGLPTTSTRKSLAARAALFADKGWPRAVRQAGRREHRTFGLNYRMTELQGAVGLAQLSKAPSFVAHRRRAAGLVTDRLRDAPGIVPPYVAPDAGPVYWFYLVSLDLAALSVDQPRFVQALRAMLHRAKLTDQEVRTLRGVVAALERRPTRPRIDADGSVTTERGRR